ncbi:uncharacterized protein LOC108594481 [Drosophila busckii]|uniref:uncharacterized protein LOC108594481 n=1 Tax=Drosophila busckii TaxID=30019 RepID=UPI00143309EA|nr:uncharacterized protein LOC108594481 [Drosophila busckii]
MKFLIVFAGLIAVALAAPQWPNGPGGFHGNNPHPSIGGYGGTNPIRWWFLADLRILVAMVEPTNTNTDTIMALETEALTEDMLDLMVMDPLTEDMLDLMVTETHMDMVDTIKFQ